MLLANRILLQAWFLRPPAQLPQHILPSRVLRTKLKCMYAWLGMYPASKCPSPPPTGFLGRGCYVNRFLKIVCTPTSNEFRQSRRRVGHKCWTKLRTPSFGEVAVDISLLCENWPSRVLAPEAIPSCFQSNCFIARRSLQQSVVNQVCVVLTLSLHLLSLSWCGEN